MILESDILILRETEPTDLEFVCSLELDEENEPFIIPWPEEIHEKAIKSTDSFHLMIIDRKSMRPVGYIIIAGLNSAHSSLELVRITINDKGMGYGKETFRLIKNWVFMKNNSNRLWLDVKVNNERAINLYKKQGFVVEGTLRECIKNYAGFESLHIMSILKSEYMNNK
ncbi:Spermidine N(1)-acetyltransferase [Sutcliffiella rhizosphaerae]|uniref:Spermidine N(1)-acetyltransferase n=1 Tax=Sutcliffiella rhizosphaerae TaxID=2880967 RepID=A0ABM8YNE7_9BACI|nr:Spermidine N(1)-acetyltransferase [Sutcliffiella rhizosphaerae]